MTRMPSKGASSCQPMVPSDTLTITFLVPSFLKDLVGAKSEIGVALDRKHPEAEFGQDRSLVPRSRSDFKDLFMALEVKGFGHQCDDIRLRNGLLVPYGQGMIAVGLFLQGFIHKLMAWNFAHGVEHSLVVNPPGNQLSIHHAIACFLEINHSKRTFS